MMARSQSRRWGKLIDDPTNKFRGRETSEAGSLGGVERLGKDLNKSNQREGHGAHGSTAHWLLDPFASRVHDRYFA